MSQSIIITGASKGLGKNLAINCFNEGYSLALIGRDTASLEKLQGELGNRDKVTIHSCDLTDLGDVKNTFLTIAESHSDILALVNNAATWTGGKPVAELTAEDLNSSMQLNFYSAFECIKQSLRIWEDRSKPEFHIVNIGATASLRGGRKTFAFAMAKSSLRMLTQSIARELGPEGVHAVHVIIDGLIDNERTRKLNPSLAQDKFMNMDAISSSLLSLIRQERSAWTLECDMRPFTESF